MPIHHVLFDADGVLQHVPGGWFAAMDPHVGGRAQEFFRDAWSEELPMLAGAGDYMPVLAAVLEQYGVTTPVDEVYRDVWHRIEVVEPSIALVHALRAEGYGVHLGTNQERHREAYMRESLGYDVLFDTSSYSCAVGFAKPDPGFFRAAVAAIGAEPSTVLFVDDLEANVVAARSVGLAAEQWHLDDGHDKLVELLAGHGVTVAGK